MEINDTLLLVLRRERRSLNVIVIPTSSHFALRQARQSFRLNFVIVDNGVSQECLMAIFGSDNKHPTIRKDENEIYSIPFVIRP